MATAAPCPENRPVSAAGYAKRPRPIWGRSRFKFLWRGGGKGNENNWGMHIFKRDAESRKGAGKAALLHQAPFLGSRAFKALFP